MTAPFGRVWTDTARREIKSPTCIEQRSCRRDNVAQHVQSTLSKSTNNTEQRCLGCATLSLPFCWLQNTAQTRRKSQIQRNYSGSVRLREGKAQSTESLYNTNRVFGVTVLSARSSQTEESVIVFLRGQKRDATWIEHPRAQMAGLLSVSRSIRGAGF